MVVKNHLSPHSIYLCSLRLFLTLFCTPSLHQEINAQFQLSEEQEMTQRRESGHVTSQLAYVRLQVY